LRGCLPIVYGGKMKALYTMKKTIILNVLVITLAMTAALMAGGNDLPYPTDKWVNAFGGECLLNGEPLPVGAVVQAFDIDGVMCGRFVVDSAGSYGFMPVYRDDIYTPDRDEGPEPGESFTLRINGIVATTELGPDSPIWSKNGDPYDVSLSATQEISMNLVSPGSQTTSPSQTVVFLFEITNTGSGYDLYEMTATSQHGWMTEIVGGSPSIYADPGETIDITVKVHVPSDVFASVDDSLYFDAASMMDNSVSASGKTVTRVIVTAAEDDNSSVIPDKFSLAQNYPNPFNPETIISYSLKKGGTVHLEVYNILGQSAAILVDEYQDAGEYSVIWNTVESGGNFPSGVYFYRLTVNELTLTRKMVLMK
jgi:hypothetical protein